MRTKSLLFGTFLFFSILVSLSLVSASEFGYNYLETSSEGVTEGGNYSINVNNSQYFQGYIPSDFLLSTGDTATGNYTFDTNTFFIDSNNNRVGIGTTNPSEKLDVNGSVTLLDWNQNKLKLPQRNDATSPTIQFGDGDTGFYEYTDDGIRVAIGGGGQWVFAGGVFYSPNVDGLTLSYNVATSTDPSYTFTTDEDTGIGKAGADQLSLISGGSEIMRLYSDKVAVNGSIEITNNITTEENLIISNSTGGVKHWNIYEDANGTLVWEKL